MFDMQVAYIMDMLANDPESIARLLATQVWLNAIFGTVIVLLAVSDLSRRING